MPAFLLKPSMNIDFLEPWVAVGSEQDAFDKELRSELSPENYLSASVLRALARRIDCDDVLFEVCDEKADFKLASVHLTWSGRTESNPWPRAKIFTGVEDFITQMLIDAQDYE